MPTHVIKRSIRSFSLSLSACTTEAWVMTTQKSVKILTEVGGFIMPQNEFCPPCLNDIHRQILSVGQSSSSTHQLCRTGVSILYTRFILFWWLTVQMSQAHSHSSYSVWAFFLSPFFLFWTFFLSPRWQTRQNAKYASCLAMLGKFFWLFFIFIAVVTATVCEYVFSISLSQSCHINTENKALTVL